MGTKHFQQIIFGKLDIERNPVLQAVNRIQGNMTLLAGFSYLHNDSVKAIEHSLVTHEIMAVRTITLSYCKEVFQFSDLFNPSGLGKIIIPFWSNLCMALLI